MLFKEFAGVDAFPICLDTQDPDEIVRAVELMAPTFGGINLEDISAPRCFEIEDRLKEIARHPRLPRRPARHRGGDDGGAVQRAEDHRQADRGAARADGWPRRRRGSGDQDDARRRSHPHRRLRPPGRPLDRARGLRVRRDDRDQALVRGEHQPRQDRRPARRRDRGHGPLRRPLRPGDHRGRVAGEDERRRDRLRDGQPDARGDARGRRPLRADHGHRPLRLPEPDQQRALLPRHLPRRPRRRRRRASPRR